MRRCKSYHPHVADAPLLTKARVNKDLANLENRGHFLKGSSATLGFTKIKDECEKIQNLGRMKDETGNADEPDEQKCLRQIARAVAEAKRAYKDVEALMRKYYGAD